MASRTEILDLLANGKITAEEAAEMLSAPPKPDPAPVSPELSLVKEIEVENEGVAPKWFKIRVRNLETGKNKVNVNIPLKVLKFGMSIGKRFAPEMDDLRWEDVDDMVQNMQSGMLVEVEDEDSNEHVQVFLE